jgi:hypothetical protein
MDGIDLRAIMSAYTAVTGRTIEDDVRLALDRRLALTEWAADEADNMRREFGITSYRQMMSRWYTDDEMVRWNGRYGLDSDDWMYGYVPEPGMAKANGVMKAEPFKTCLRWFLRRDFAAHVKRQIAAHAAGTQPTVPRPISEKIAKAREYVHQLGVTADERDEFEAMAAKARTMADVEEIRAMVRRWKTAEVTT